jgi:hypothetical protein
MAGLTSEAQQRIDAYLAKLRMRLPGIGEQDIREIVAELRSHILDKTIASEDVVTVGAVEATLAALGTPEQLAGEYLRDNLLARAEVSRSPAQILEILFRCASLSVAGFFVFIASTAGYFLGTAFVLCALLKPIHPRTAGLWIIPAGTEESSMSLRLGFASAPSNGREVLGWWIVPLGLMLGCGLFMLTTRFGLSCVRRYRKTRTLPPG